MKHTIAIRKVIEVLKEYKTEGHKPLQVMADDFELYVAKSGKGHHPPISLINELVCSYFLGCWGLKTPDATLLKLDTNLIEIPLSTTNKKSFYQDLCFGSKLVPEAIEVNDLANSKSAWQFNRLKSPFDLMWIGLFDIWVENDDRKPSNPNLLLKECAKTALFDIYAIDHAYTFYSTGYEVLVPSEVCQSYNDSILYSDFVKSVIPKVAKKQELDFKASFWAKIERCKENFDNFADAIPIEIGFSQHLRFYLSGFLFNEDRNKLVFQTFLERLN